MKWQPLQELCEIKKGHSITEKSVVAGNIPVVAGGQSIAYFHNVANRDAGIITISASGAYAGYVNFWDIPIFASDCTTVKSISDSLRTDYLYKFLKSKQQYIYSLQRGAGQPHIYGKDIENIKILLPPLEIQHKIVAMLDKAQELIDLRKAQLVKLDDFLRSLFWDMFGDPISNNKGFQLSPLSEFITHMTSGGRGWARYYSNAGDRFIRSLDVQMNHISSEDSVYVIPPKGKETDRTRTEIGDVLLTITGSCIGRVAYVPENFGVAYISQHVAIIRTEGINAIYLSFYLSMPNAGQLFIGKQQYGQTKPGLNFNQISSFPILKAPLSLQTQFAAIVGKIEQQKTLMQQSLTEMENNFNGLMHQAFRGDFF